MTDQGPWVTKTILELEERNAELEGQLTKAVVDREWLVGALDTCVTQLENEDPRYDCLDNGAADFGRIVLVTVEGIK